MSRYAYEKLLTKIDNAFDELHDAIRYDELTLEDDEQTLGDLVRQHFNTVTETSEFDTVTESPEYDPLTETSEFNTVTESPQHFDPVTDPVQYHIGGIETIDIMRIVLTREEFKGYLKGNIIKYRERAMHKGKPEEDWAKAREYKRIYTIEFGHTDMSELKDEFDNGVGTNYWNGVLLGTQGDSRPKKEYR